MADKKSSGGKGEEDVRNGDELENEKFPGYPSYPPQEDIYNKEEEADLDPENMTKKTDFEFPESQEVLDLDAVESGDDLDIPGAEIDDQQELIGSEDEENNYYSLGGDDNDSLEEDQGLV